MSELYLFDQRYRSEYGVIAGLDEAGRGPLAGPLVACAVILSPDFDNDILTDSKKLTDKSRRRLKPAIEDSAEAVSLGIVTSSEIDRNRMTWAVRTSFRRAMTALHRVADVFLIDGNSVAGLDAPSRFLVKGDSKSLSIAAASVIAKVTRDDIMLKAHEEFPEYGFDRHKGYGTAAHIDVLKRTGPCPLHRMSFAPLSNMYQTGQMSLFPLDAPNPGRAAEIKAARHYENLGFRVLERNWRSSSGEIDLILENGDTVLFVEVKSTLTGGEKQALQRIDEKKLTRLRNAAAEWMTETGYQGDCTLEAALVTPDGTFRIPLR
ncbi:MAG: ribonuclease HII [Candidatus Sabulitectum sp.]|nr:ribonuclease HII [Candidatus Sabulitectum sp.]